MSRMKTPCFKMCVNNKKDTKIIFDESCNILR